MQFCKLHYLIEISSDIFLFSFVVILAPYGLCGTLTGNTYRDTDQASRSVLDEWSRYYPGEVLDAKDAYNENANKLPSVVEVIIGKMCNIVMRCS